MVVFVQATFWNAAFADEFHIYAKEHGRCKLDLGLRSLGDERYVAEFSFVGGIAAVSYLSGNPSELAGLRWEVRKKIEIP